jgi:hypothetical protein
MGIQFGSGQFNSIQLNSVQFIGYLLMCRLNSTSACYKASTKTQTLQIHKNKTLNRRNKNSMAGERQYKQSTGEKTLNPEEYR